MRRITMLSLAVAGLFILTSATAARANWYHKSESSGGGTSEMTSPSSETGAEAPEVGTYQGQEATEAGKIPSGEQSMSSGSESPGPEGFQNLKFGGAKVREGLDTIP